MARQIIVSILGDASKFNAATGQATASAGKFNNVLKGIGQGIGIAAFANIANVAGSVARGVENYVKDSIGAASDLNESLSKNTVIFGDSAGAIESWAKTGVASMGLSENAAVSATGQFGNLFNTIGLGQKVSGDMSMTMVQLAADLASFNNISQDDAMAKLQSGLVGEAKPLRDLGILLNEAQVKAKGMAMGLADATGNLSEGAKVQARYALILEQSGTAQGDFKRTSDGLANSQRILDANLQNLSANIGGILIPVTVGITGEFNNLFTSMSNISDESVSLVDKLAGVGDGLSVLNPITLANNVLTSEMAQANKRAADKLDATKQAAADLLTPISDIKQGFRDAASGADDVAGATGAAERPMNNLGNSAEDAAGQIKDFHDQLQSAIDLMIQKAYSPEQLRLELEGTQLAIQKNVDHLHDLEKIKNPTLDQRIDINNTKQAISDNSEKVQELQAKLRGLDGISQQDIDAAIKGLGGKLGNAADEAAALLKLLQQVNSNYTKFPSNSGLRKGMGLAAAGGYHSGLTLVGEKGPEIVDLPSGSYVHTNAESMRMTSPGGSAAKSAPVININISEGAFIDGPSIDRLTNMIAQRLNYSRAM